jgi:hypothetical protein
MYIQSKTGGQDAMVYLHFEDEPLSGSPPTLVVRATRGSGASSNYSLSKASTSQKSLTKVPLGHWVEHADEPGSFLLADRPGTDAGASTGYILFRVDSEICAKVAKETIMVRAAIPISRTSTPPSIPAAKSSASRSYNVSCLSPLMPRDALDGDVLNRSIENLCHVLASPTSPLIRV